MFWEWLLWALLTARPAARINLPPPMLQPFPAKFWSWPYKPPRLVPWMLPYERWEAEYRNNFRRHYHDPRLTFRPSMIVMHYTVTSSAEAVRAGFLRGGQMDAGDYGLVFGHPSVQLMVDKDGTVLQLLPLDRRCTGCYGVNHKALSIEMVALSEKDLLSRPKQVFASFCLVRYLMRRFSIPAAKVYGHIDVSIGTWACPEYLDYADSKWPHGYPPTVFRFDPGLTYMGWLRWYLRRTVPVPRS